MSNSRARIVLLLAVAAVAAGMRVAWLESTPLWWDEFVTLGRAKLPLAEMWTSLAHQGPSDSSLDSSPPLLHAILHGVLVLGGACETWVKLPSVLFGVLTVLAVSPLGGRLFGGRSGLYASALLGLSLYHLHYSREARPYSLYLLLAVSSLWLLLRALDLNRARDWAAYALTATAMLYASYLGGVSLAAQMMYLALLAAWRRLPPGRLLRAELSLAAVGLAYLPWLPGHLFHMRLIYDPNGDMGLTWPFLERAMLEFSTDSVLTLGCAVLGMAVGLARAPAKALLLLSWLALPLAAALSLRTGIAVNPRYLMNFVPGLALLAGAGLDGLVKGLSLAIPGRVAALFGLAGAVALSWPSLVQMPDYYRRDRHSVRDDLLAVAENAANADALAFPRNRHLKMFARWYLPGLYGDLSRSGDLRYRRALLLAGPDFAPAMPGKPETYGELRAWRVGLLNLSPLPAAGTYRADFSGLSLYKEAAFWDNLGPDLFQNTLSLYDPERAGRMVWRFTAPEGGLAGPARLRCRLRLTASQAAPPDATVTILAGDSPAELKALRTVSQADFGSGQDLEVELAIPAPSGRELAVGLHLEPGIVHGSLEPTLFVLSFANGQQAPAPGQEALQGRATLAQWRPGVDRAGDDALLAFSPGDPRLPDFLAENPGIVPVARLNGLDLYDPALAKPLVSLPGREVHFAGQSLQGVRLTGPLSGQVLSLGGLSLPVPRTAPPGSAVDITPAGGRIRADLDFSSGLPEPFLAFSTAMVPGAPCLTCEGENHCFLVYALDSPAPIRSVRVAWNPEAYGEPGRANSVGLSLSVDGNAYQALDRLVVKDSELWEGKKRRISRVEVSPPSKRLYLRFDLSGDGARLWAGPGTPLRIDAWTDPPLSLPARLPNGPVATASTGPALSLFLSPKPLPDLDRLLAPH